MGEGTHLLRGVVKGGVIVPDTDTELPDGTAVEFRVVPAEFTPEERAEYEAWEQSSAEAFQMILDMEAEEERNERG